MPRTSRTGNVRKICRCTPAKRNGCAHPWYLDYQKENRRLRQSLDRLIGRHANNLSDAQDEARRAIQALIDGRDPRGLVPADDPTVREVLEEYDREKPRGDRWQVGRVCGTRVPGIDGEQPLGEWRARQVTAAALKAFRSRRPPVAANRDLALLRAAFNWAVVNGLVDHSPFRVGDVAVVRLTREQARTRRLQGDEETRLLAAAGGLRDVLVAAIETGCRRGELLSLQWHQVRFTPRAEIFLPAHKTKAKRDRRVPMSSVLRAVLEHRRAQRDPAGELLPPAAYVFGDEIGRPRCSIKTAWRFTCQRAHIEDLHFHDLRREAGSRWMDAGVPLATIQRWLGHANIAQTSTYLGASLGADDGDMRAFEERVGRFVQTIAISRIA